MMQLFTTSQLHLIDVMISVLVLEIAVLALNRVVRGTGIASAELIAFLGAGLSMLVGVRVMAGGGSLAAFAAAMLLSLVLHLWHVRQRWQR
jgi:hypothetical protein